MWPSHPPSVVFAVKTNGMRAPSRGGAAFIDNQLGELKLGCGWLPDTWRESDDISYAIREVTRTDTAAVFNYSTPLGLPALREQLLKRLAHIQVVTITVLR